MTTAALPIAEESAPRNGRSFRRRVGWAWLGLVPFLIFAGLFLIIPASYLVAGSLQDQQGQFTLQNYASLTQGEPIEAYKNSIEISLVTAVGGGVFGFLLAYAVIAGRLPRIFRSGTATFSGVASNFAGVPLALAFTFTLGRVGLVSVFLKGIGIDIYGNGFTLYSKIGLEIVYLYFQLPLMFLIIAPAIDGLKKEWREASENMGASSAQYWRHIALPVLLPTILGTMILLFGNAFGAQATAYQLTGGLLNIVTILISRQLTGDVLHNEGEGFALAMGMVAIMAVTIIAYVWLQRRTERWER